MPPKKKKAPVVKQMNTRIQGYKQPLNYNVEKAIKPKKIRPNEIFDGLEKKKKKKKKKKY